jgi:hypothetical protein
MYGKYLQQDPSLRPEIGFIILPLRLTLSYLEFSRFAYQRYYRNSPAPSIPNNFFDACQLRFNQLTMCCNLQLSFLHGR